MRFEHEVPGAAHPSNVQFTAPVVTSHTGWEQFNASEPPGAPLPTHQYTMKQGQAASKPVAVSLFSVVLSYKFYFCELCLSCLDETLLMSPCHYIFFCFVQYPWISNFIDFPM